jgi:hypothetical protein
MDSFVISKSAVVSHVRIRQTGANHSGSNWFAEQWNQTKSFVIVLIL